MQRTWVWPAVLLMALSGCLAAAGDDAVGLTAARSSQEPVLVNGTVVLGWVAGAGSPNGMGDFVVGIRTSDQCPEAWFSVPEGASDLSLSVSKAQGVGPYDIVVSNPEAIVFHFTTGEAFEFREPSPPPGLWSIEMVPEGATVNQRWTVEGSYNAAEPGALDFTIDGKCMP